MYSFLLFSFVPLSYHIGIRLAKEIRFYGYFCDTNRSNGGGEQKKEENIFPALTAPLISVKIRIISWREPKRWVMMGDSKFWRSLREEADGASL